MEDLIKGVLRFEKDIYPDRKDFFDRLIAKQYPKALFITCADSRVVPNMITDSDPGDLFTIRNAGNIIPPYGEYMGGVSATIEYAAQAAAVHGGLVAAAAGGNAPPGFLASARDVRLASWRLDDLPPAEPDQLSIVAERQAGDAGQLLYTFRVAHAGREIASGRLAVVLGAEPA